MAWTDAMDRLLIKLWNAGGSLETIAADMRAAGYADVSRNSVAGRKNRLPAALFNNAPRPPPIRQAPPPRWPPPAKVRPMPRSKPAPAVKAEHRGIEYLKMRDGSCRAILDRRGGQYNLPMVCGEPRIDDSYGMRSSYCMHHHLLYNVGDRRK